MKESWDVSIQHSAPKLCLDRKKKKGRKKIHPSEIFYTSFLLFFFFSQHAIHWRNYHISILAFNQKIREGALSGAHVHPKQWVSGKRVQETEEAKGVSEWGEKGEHWESGDVSGKKAKHSKRRRQKSQGESSGQSHLLSQTPKRAEDQCNQLISWQSHKSYQRRRKLSQGRVTKSTLNSALVLLPSITHLSTSYPDYVPRHMCHPRWWFPKALPSLAPAALTPVLLPDMACTDCSVSTQPPPGTRICLPGYRCLLWLWTMFPRSWPARKELTRSTDNRLCTLNHFQGRFSPT